MNIDMKKRNILLAVIVVLFGLSIAGGTYAFLTTTLVVNNAIYNVTADCFTINYDAGSEGTNIISGVNTYNNMTVSNNVYTVNYTQSLNSAYLKFNLSSSISANQLYILKFDVSGLTGSNNVGFGFPTPSENVTQLVNGTNIIYFSSATQLSSATLGDYVQDNTATFTLSNFKLYPASSQSLDMVGTLFPSSGPAGGISGMVSLKIAPACSLEGSGTLTLNVSVADVKLTTSGTEHCENSRTLETLHEYTSSASCNGHGVWTSTSTPLKYAVYNNNTATGNPLASGYVSASDVGAGRAILKNLTVDSTQRNYYVYFWLDGYMTDNTYVDLPFNANISARVMQTES